MAVVVFEVRAVPVFFEGWAAVGVGAVLVVGP